MPPWARLLPLIAALLAGAVYGAVDKSGVKPQVVSLPSGPGSIEGLGESFQPQLNTGSAAYSIPIRVPPGVNGQAPELALQYSSGSGNGHFGIGWGLGLPAIQRQTDKGQPRYGEGDVFVYSDGEELVPLADGTWRRKNESSFMRFRRIGDGWEATDRGGHIYRLGQYPDESNPGRAARVGNGGTAFDQTFRWYLTSAADTNGNRIDYFYSAFTDSPGELYLTEVRYNSNGGDYNAVTIDYEERPDATADYRPGFQVRTARRGSRIRVLSRGSLVRDYRLEYDPEQAEILDPTAPGAVVFAISLLTKVTQGDNGNTGVNYLPPLRLGYTRLHTRDQDNPPLGNFPGPEDVDLNGNGSEDGAGLQAMADAPVNLNFQDGNADFLEVNGDGLPDVIHTDAAADYYYPNRDGQRFGARQTMANRSGVHLSAAEASLADLDGDGLADLVNKPGTGLLVGFRNRGNGSWSDRVDYANPIPGDLNDPNVRLLDLDCDKRIDLVRSISGSQWQVCRQAAEADIDLPPFDNFPAPEDLDRNGNGRLDGGTWSCSGAVPVPFPPAVRFSNPGVHLADMNGDRLQDVVWVRQLSSTETIIWYWPSMGGGRFDQYVVMADQVSTGPVDITTLRVADVTGDGLADLLKVQSGLVTAWINLGRDRWSAPITFGAPDFDPATTAIRIADMNGSGSADLVWIKAVGNAAERYQYLDLAPAAKPNQLKIIDNGLGRRITISYRSSTSDQTQAAGEGNPWGMHSPVSSQVVSRVAVSPGLDLDGLPGADTYVTDYSYRDPYYDAYEKQFRGFAFVKKIERGDAAAPTQVTRISFHTGAPDGIDNNGDGQLDERTTLGGAEEESLKGQVLTQEAATADAGADTTIGDGAPAADTNVFSRTRNDWTIRRLHHPDGGSRGIATLDERSVSFAFSPRQDTVVIELGSGAPITTRKTFDYDDFGNLTAASDLGDLAAPGDERMTLTEYATDTARWIIDKPSHQTQTDAAGNRVAEHRYYYDGAPYTGLSSGQVEKGNLTRESAWVAGDTFIDSKRKAYDPHGNVVGILDPDGTPGGDGHWVEIAYDPIFATFPVSETIHVGGGSPPLSITADYDLGLGVMTESRDFNGQVTRYGYDSFGRLVSIVKPGETEALPTASFAYLPADPVRGLRYDYAPDGTLMLTPAAATASAVVTHMREESGQPGTLDTWRYVDGLGRALAEAAEGEQGYIFSSAVRFNARGTVRETFQPYPVAAPDYAPPSALTGASQGSTLVSMDAAGREVQRTNPPESFAPGAARTQVSTSYLPLGSTVTDEEGKTKSTRNDGLGRLMEVQEVNAGEVYSTRYTYNPADSLTRITDALGNRKHFAYDGLQRKVFMDDPDRGHLTWAYDPASNLIETLDAKGQRIAYTYDGANRLLTEDYLDAGASFAANRTPDVAYHYDSPRGLVDLGDNTSATATDTKGRLAWVEDLTGEEHTAYDTRGRETWVLKRIRDPFTGVPVPFTTRMTYDALDRVRDLTYPDLDRISQRYNARGLLERINAGLFGSGGDAIVGNLDYQPSGQKARCDYGNGVTTTYAYDPRLRLTALRTSPAAQPGEPLIDYAYTFDGASNIRRIDDLRPGSVAPVGDPRRNTQVFTYDDLYRLTGVRYSFALPGAPDRDDGGIAYAYDPIGNMLSQTSGLVHLENGLSVTNLGAMSYGGTAGRRDRDGRRPGDPPGPHALTLAAAGTVQRPYPYDDNGNMRAVDGLQLTWDFKDRLVAAENAVMRAEYAYDYTDRRIVKRVTPKQGADPEPTATVYVNRWFEVREHDQPVKYVFDGDTRVAQTTGSLDATAERVQRFRIYPGWNLIGLAVDAGDAADQIGIGSNPSVQDVYRWVTGSESYVALAAGADLSAGAVLWVKASTPLGLRARGAQPATSVVNLPQGSSFLAVPNLQGLTLAEKLPAELESAWWFDPQVQSWRGYFTGEAAFLTNAPPTIPPGSVLFLDAAKATEITPPDSSHRIAYYHQDHVGSSNVVLSPTDQTRDETSFYPFGSPRASLPANLTLPLNTSYLFAQKELDQESALQYFEARYLGAPFGRFLSPDPVLADIPKSLLVDPQALGAYAYARSNPVVYSDTSGEIIETLWDIANVAMDVGSLAGNVAGGNWGGAAVDLVGLVADVASVALPGVPGGAGTAIKTARAADKAVDVLKTADKAGDALRTARKAEDVAKRARAPDFVVTPNGTAIPVSQNRMRQSFDAAGFPSRPSVNTAESGVIHTVPTSKGPIDVRTMEGSAHHSRRAVATTPGTNSPRTFDGGTPLGTKSERRAASHLEQTP